jgi:fluoroacetyl-CoA thioesterase
MAMTPGQRAEFSYRVTAADTAAQLGSGDVAVLGTPRVLALMERATVQAVARSLEPGETTVGVSAHLEHLAASPVGATVDVEAVVQERTGRRITCTARMSAGERTLATANIVRVVVNRATFEAGTG